MVPLLVQNMASKGASAVCFIMGQKIEFSNVKCWLVLSKINKLQFLAVKISLNVWLFVSNIVIFPNLIGRKTILSSNQK